MLIKVEKKLERRNLKFETGKISYCFSAKEILFIPIREMQRIAPYSLNNVKAF